MPKCTPETRKPSLPYKSLLVFLVAGLICLTGCGLKGDLTLEPDTPPESVTESAEEVEQDNA